MFKEILYGVGGLIGLFIFLALILPSPEQNTFPVSETGNITQQKVVVSEDVVSTAVNSVEEEIPSSDPVVEKEITPSPTPAKQQSPVVPVSTNSQFQYYAVTDVVDGDTLKINMGGTVETLRLIGIDTPETVDPRKPVQCFGTEASNRAKALLSGQKVRIEADSTQDTRDKYGRLLVYIYRDDGLFFNKSMVADGYAYEYTYDKAYKYQAEFKAAQLAAQNAGKGLWSPTTCNGKADPVAQPSTGSKYYTSSHYSAKYYYPASCDGWKGLSESYLESFDTLDALLAKYNRTLSPQCQ